MKKKVKWLKKIIFQDLLEMANRKVNKINTMENYFTSTKKAVTSNVNIDIREQKFENVKIVKKKQKKLTGFFTVAKKS